MRSEHLDLVERAAGEVRCGWKNGIEREWQCLRADEVAEKSVWPRAHQSMVHSSRSELFLRFWKYLSFRQVIVITRPQ